MVFVRLNFSLYLSLSRFPFSSADNFAFCCMMGWDNLSPSRCVAPVDQFSSCKDLLKDQALRSFMWILGLSALLGNLFVIGVRVCRKNTIKTNRIQSTLITNLAVSDLLMGCYMIIIASADEHYRGHYALHSKTWRTSSLCRFAGFLSAFSSEVSVFIIMLISIDRVVNIVFPFHPSVKMTRKTATILLTFVWVFALFISLIPVMSKNIGEFYSRSSVCLGLPLTTDRTPGWGYSVGIFLALNLVCFLVTAVGYIAIFVTFRKSSNRVKHAKGSRSQSPWVILSF